jgi:hypothetical protein
MNGVRKSMFKVLDGSEVTFEYCDKLSCGELSRNIREKECGFGDVERLEWFYAVHHEEGSMTGIFSCRYTVGPKDMVSESGPLSDIAIACLNEGVLNSPMGAFNKAVCP